MRGGLGLATEDDFDGNHIVNRGLLCISIMHDVNLSKLPDNFDIHVDQIFSRKFDILMYLEHCFLEATTQEGGGWVNWIS